MKNINQLTDSDYEQMAQQIEQIKDSKSESELIDVIENALSAGALTHPELNTFLEDSGERGFAPQFDETDLMASINLFSDQSSVNLRGFAHKHNRFWKKFEKKLRETICSNDDIRQILGGKGTVKQYLKVGIPIMIGLMGFSALNPVVLAVIASVFAIILKTGFAAYCEV